MELSSKGISYEFLFWLTPQEEEMRRILHFRWIKGVLLLKSTSGKQSGFSCWGVIQILTNGGSRFSNLAQIHLIWSLRKIGMTLGPRILILCTNIRKEKKTGHLKGVQNISVPYISSSIGGV